MTRDGRKVDLNRQTLEDSARNYGEKEDTFIRAFESSPVHCAKSRPSGNRRKPGNGGTAEILKEM